MHRRSSLRDFPRPYVSGIAKVFSFALLAIPAIAFADAADPIRRTDFGLERPVNEGNEFVEFLRPAPASREDSIGFISDELLTQKPTEAAKTLVLLASAATEIRTIIVADADPNFDRWQKDADERLKAEGMAGKPKLHPLAAAHPGKSVIVCEAGCGSPIDEIVYMADPVPAEVQVAQLEPTSSGGGAAADDRAVPCIAGCYDREEPAPRPAIRKTEIPGKPAVILAVAKSITLPAVTGVIDPGQKREKSRHAALRVASRPHAPRSKVHHLQICQNGAIVEGQRGAHARKLTVQLAGKAPVRHRDAVRHTWQAKVHYAVPPAQLRHLAKATTTGWLTYVRIVAH